MPRRPRSELVHPRAVSLTASPPDPRVPARAARRGRGRLDSGMRVADRPWCVHVVRTACRPDSATRLAVVAMIGPVAVRDGADAVYRRRVSTPSLPFPEFSFGSPRFLMVMMAGAFPGLAAALRALRMAMARLMYRQVIHRAITPPRRADTSLAPSLSRGPRR